MALEGFFHFLQSEEGGAERVGPGDLRQCSGIHGGVLPAELQCNEKQG